VAGLDSSLLASAGPQATGSTTAAGTNNAAASNQAPALKTNSNRRGNDFWRPLSVPEFSVSLSGTGHRAFPRVVDQSEMNQSFGLAVAFANVRHSIWGWRKREDCEI
jgi:hypothetical protein